MVESFLGTFSSREFSISRLRVFHFSLTNWWERMQPWDIFPPFPPNPRGVSRQVLDRSESETTHCKLKIMNPVVRQILDNIGRLDRAKSTSDERWNHDEQRTNSFCRRRTVANFQAKLRTTHSQHLY